MASRRRTFLLILIGLICVAYFAGGGNSGSRSQPEPPLTARIQHLGPNFAVTNNDTFDWRDCDLEVNSDYTLKTSQVHAGRTIDLAAANFAKPDGTRFNWLATKPQQMFIYCRNAPASPRSALAGWR